MQHLKINIQGKLQDTGYMYFVRQIAFLYGIKGFVKYTDDDSVLISAEGKPDAMKRFVELSRIGSYNIKIEHYEATKSPVVNYEIFEIK